MVGAGLLANVVGAGLFFGRGGGAAGAGKARLAPTVMGDLCARVDPPPTSAILTPTMVTLFPRHHRLQRRGQYRPLLQIVADQALATVTLREIIVVASGCTDRTEDDRARRQARDPRVRLLVQARREGKASAINLFLQRGRRKRCSCSAAPTCSRTCRPLERLVAPFADPEVGMTACRPVPVNDPATFMGFAAHLLWDLHHDINAAGGFKAGEMIAFRKVFTPHSVHDRRGRGQH